MTERVPARRRRRPGPLPVLFASLSTFAVVWVMLMARLLGGHDPAAGPLAALPAPAPGHAPVVTRSSGGHAGARKATPSSTAPAAPVTTRSSGGEEEIDD
jgi:hypothetical protein